MTLEEIYESLLAQTYTGDEMGGFLLGAMVGAILIDGDGPRILDVNRDGYIVLKNGDKPEIKVLVHSDRIISMEDGTKVKQARLEDFLKR